MPAGPDLRELERLLVVAAETGETMTRARVQDEFQVGAGDADGMLSALREHGKAVEVAPGEWRGPTQDELDRAPAEPERVVVDVPDENGDGAGTDDVMAQLQAGGRGGGWTGARVAQVLGEPTVRLTRGIAEALDAEAVGKLVKAALDGLEEGEIFVLEVTP